MDAPANPCPRPPAVAVENLHVSYTGNTVLREINFAIEEQNLVAIMGPNGAGKSTLMKTLVGLTPVDAGTVRLFGKPVREGRRQVAYVPQRNDIDWAFPIRVLETAMLGTYPNLGWFRRPGKKDREWALHCLQRVDMADYAHRQIGELSGGQQQRVFIARALAQRPRAFFLDEPFVGIDMASEEMILDILHELRDEGKTILVVHHDVGTVQEHFDRVILINRELVGSGPVERVLRPELLSTIFRPGPPLLHGLEVQV